MKQTNAVRGEDSTSEVKISNRKMIHTTEMTINHPTSTNITHA